jgi:hypothetical protein
MSVLQDLTLEVIPSHLLSLFKVFNFLYFFSDTPAAPGLPEIVDWDETMVKLKWEPPIRDGGAPITGDFSIV